MKKRIIYLLLSITLLFTFACSSDDDDDTTPSKTTVQTFEIALSYSNSLPIVTGRTETGSLTMTLFSDNSLDFNLSVTDLASSDQLTAAHIHSGDPVSTGGVEIVLVDGTNISFSGNSASGTINLTAAQINSLQGSDIYISVHSNEVASGLLRGQVDQLIDKAYNIALSPSNAVPAITGRSDAGVAYFRLVGSKMYYKVVGSNLDTSDSITAGHLHEGSATENGGVFLSLDITDNAQLGVSKNITLNSGDLDKMKNSQLYVNIHSAQVASGLLRGQVR